MATRSAGPTDGVTAAPQITAAAEAGATMRMAVRVTVRGTSATSSVAPHTTHSATETTVRNDEFRESSVSARAGPAVNGRVTHTSANAHLRSSTRSWVFASAMPEDLRTGAAPGYSIARTTTGGGTTHGRRSARTAARRAVDLHRQPAA